MYAKPLLGLILSLSLASTAAGDRLFSDGVYRLYKERKSFEKRVYQVYRLSEGDKVWDGEALQDIELDFDSDESMSQDEWHRKVKEEMLDTNPFLASNGGNNNLMGMEIEKKGDEEEEQMQNQNKIRMDGLEHTANGEPETNEEYSERIEEE